MEEPWSFVEIRMTPIKNLFRHARRARAHLPSDSDPVFDIGPANGGTALHLAARKNDIEFAERLINDGADINAELTSGPLEGFTPLHCAVSGFPLPLHCTVSDFSLSYGPPKGSGEIIKKLLSNGANVNATSKKSVTPLHAATKFDRVPEVALLLKHGADPNVSTNDNKTALRTAVENGYFEVVKLLLKHCPNLNNKLHSDILSIAGVNGRNSSPFIIRELLRYGFPLAEESITAFLFYKAMKEQNTIYVEELLKRGFQVNKLYQHECGSSFMPLHLAVQEDLLSAARILISYGADVNAHDEDGRSPIFYVDLHKTRFQPKHDSGCNSRLMMLKLLIVNKGKLKDNPNKVLPFAFQYGGMEQIELFLNHDEVDVNEGDSSGVTALHYAVLRFCSSKKKLPLRPVKLLLEKGAQVNARTPSNVGVLHIAAALDPEHSDLLETLLEYDADVNISCETITPLHICAFRDNLEFCRILLSRGANLHAKLVDGKTAAHITALYDRRGQLKARGRFQSALGCFSERSTADLLSKMDSSVKLFNKSEIIKAFSEFDVDLNLKDYEGKTALHYAVDHSSFPEAPSGLVRTLITHGADWTAREKYWKTPLHCVAEKFVGTVGTLVELGADINSKDVHGCTPLHTLVRQKLPGKVANLLKVGSDINALNNVNQTPLQIALNAHSRVGTQKSGTKVIKILKRHIIKLKVANLYIDPKNLTAFGTTNRGGYNSCYRACEREIEGMKAQFIGGSKVSFYDILTSSRKELVRLAKNDELLRALEKYKFDNFPIYDSELKIKVLHLYQALRRASLLDKSEVVFRQCIADLPDLCIDAVLDNLSDDDLENLVRARHPHQVFPKKNNSKYENYLHEYDQNDLRNMMRRPDYSCDYYLARNNLPAVNGLYYSDSGDDDHT